MTLTSLSFSVNCEWSAWDQPLCPATCGSSVFITKTRRKKLEASDGGLDCEGKSEIKEQCNIPECKIVLQEVIKGRLPLSSILNKKGNFIQIFSIIKCRLSYIFKVTPTCTWSKWKEFPCTATCGVFAIRKKTRHKIKTSGEPYVDCKGSSMRIESCKYVRCPGNFSSLGSISSTF